MDSGTEKGGGAGPIVVLLTVCIGAQLHLSVLLAMPRCLLLGFYPMLKGRKNPLVSCSSASGTVKSGVL